MKGFASLLAWFVLQPMGLAQGQGAMQSAGAGRVEKAVSPVVWELAAYPRAPLRAGGEAHVAVQATIAAGWHLYALDEPEDGPVPLEFSMQPGEPLALVSVGADRPMRGAATGFAATVNFYVGRPRFRLRLRAGSGRQAPAGPAVIEIRFQACNDRLCLPPRTATISVPVTVGAGRP